jgi:hypothetical protein
MKLKTKNHRNRDGVWHDDYEVDDGAEVRVPIMLADSQPRKWPGWVSPLSDREVALLDQHKAGFRTTDLADIRRPAIEARDRWVASLSDRSPVPSPKLTTELRRPLADTSTSGPGPAATLSSGGVPDDPQSRRDAAWNLYKDQLGNAWRGPGPGVAGASSSWKGPAA